MTPRDGRRPAAAPDLASTSDFLLPSEVAVIFRVDRKTVTRWGKSGRLPSVRTPGGHHRFPADAVLALVGNPTEPADPGP